MSFGEEITVFPNNIAEIIATRIEQKYPPPDINVFRRPLQATDSSQSIGVFPGVWMPDETSFEMPSKEPTVQRYTIIIQCFVKHFDREEAVKIHSVMSKVIRSLLYNDTPLKLGLDVLSVTMDGAIERIQKRGITRQQYLSNEIEGVFHCLSTLEYWIETENK